MKSVFVIIFAVSFVLALASILVGSYKMLFKDESKGFKIMFIGTIPFALCLSIAFFAGIFILAMKLI